MVDLQFADGEPARRTIDIGRIIAVTIFTVLLALNISSLFSDLPSDTVVRFVEIASRILTIAFLAMLTFAYVRRSHTTRTDRDWRAWVVALLGTAAPFFIPLVADGQRGATPAGLAGLIVLTVGGAAMIWALSSLGTNISVVPQAREVVTDGAYARVRHPLYSAELLNVLGLCLTFTGIAPWLILGALVAFQYIRARREEALLSRELEGYPEYMLRTPMLLPRLGRT